MSKKAQTKTNGNGVTEAEAPELNFESAGTTVGAEMLARSHPAGWGGPCFTAGDDGSGGVLPGEAQLLYGLVRAMRPAVVLELGTGYGWSAMHIAQALKDNGTGHLHTVEVRPERRALALEHLRAAELDGWVSIHDGTPVLERVDFAFLDALHHAPDVRGYLEALPVETGLVAVHDARWEGHLDRAVEGLGWQVFYLPKTSYEGLALLQREHVA